MARSFFLGKTFQATSQSLFQELYDVSFVEL